ncbi:hypothetical protein DFH07DRAFT_947150 [Mycena maculata]|uniref:Uncharacterized protein n=1 Tax=Mycena maculata TaxID=230809 RepID=A0AAD7HF44_9AGAR|nr:hypothetical protein DFH07DRAFT_947150 [Mycena maculata]
MGKMPHAYPLLPCGLNWAKDSGRVDTHSDLWNTAMPSNDLTATSSAQWAPRTGSIFSAIGRGIEAVISAIAAVIMAIVGAITTVIVTIFDVIVDIICCRCGSRSGGSRRSRRRGGMSGGGATY